MLGSDTTMGLSWRWNTVGCTVEPLDGYGWFLGSLTCYAPFSAGSDSLLPWKERKEIWAVEHILCPRAMPSAPPCRARLERVNITYMLLSEFIPVCHTALYTNKNLDRRTLVCTDLFDSLGHTVLVLISRHVFQRGPCGGNTDVLEDIRRISTNRQELNCFRYMHGVSNR